jgi:hypothetical protein
VVKSRRMIGVGRVEKMERKTYKCWNLIGTPEGTRSIDVDGRMISKLMLKI